MVRTWKGAGAVSEERTMIDWFDEVYTICKDIPLDRLRELATADAEGRVAVLPNCNLCERRREKNGIAETARIS